MESEWISIKDKLPPINEMVLVIGYTHEGVALGEMRNSGYWDIQPFMTSYYETKTGITNWHRIDNNDVADSNTDF